MMRARADKRLREMAQLALEAHIPPRDYWALTIHERAAIVREQRARVNRARRRH